MTKKMLIDATHDEETRVAVVDGRKLMEFDYESKFRKPLKGSIFLAKVTRVEPSLQAAFVNFGGNRHGFLPFAEIHPDYFRIPIADREALLAEQQEMIEAQEAAERERDQQEQEQHQHSEEGGEARSEEAQEVIPEKPDEDNVEYLDHEDDVVEEIGGNENDDNQAAPSDAQPEQGEPQDEPHDDPAHDDHQHLGEPQDEDQPAEEGQGEGEGSEEGEQSGRGEHQEGGRGGRGGRYPRRGRRGGGRGRHRMAHRSNRVEKFGGEDYSQEDRFRFNLRRKYKIQEVIKRGQIMLVQVSKEERGNKGAAVSTYLSLPGRYCVLMPNSPRAGGVSRKIANYQDRARVKEIMQEIQVPQGMSVIVRTAGVSRTKPEINRDLDYLMRLWDNIRELTLQSSAPAKVYEEADLIKRAVRDLYSKDIEEIIVAGDEGFKTARNFMKMMIPSHVKRVIEHTDDVPLLTRYHVEEQIAEIGEARVTLPSGGYLIINQTEALVAVDVNSGKATKERHIEETALKTNMEAASEIARQLRLRDLGGLIVIDFIDMEDRRNNSKVERRVREALSTDRARIQMSRISSFGLMELSRQRLNPSLTESQFEVCPHCAGLGRIRTADAMSIMVLRAIEAEGIKGRKGQNLIAHVSNDVAVYILNNKRKNVTDIEGRYNMNVLIRVDESMGASGFRIEAVKGSGPADDDGEPLQPKEVRSTDVHASDLPDDGLSEDSIENAAPGDEAAGEEFPDSRPDRGGDRADRGEGQERGGRRRGRRGGRRRGRREWRDRDEAVGQQGVNPQHSEAPHGEEFGDDDEFRDAAAHQAIHDRHYVEGEERHDSGNQPRHGRGDRSERGDRDDRGGRNRGRRGGRNRGGRGRDGGGRSEHRGERKGNGDRFDSNRSQGPRPERSNSDQQPQQRVQHNEPREEREEQNFNVEPKPQAATAPKSYEKKDYEKLNEAPGEKKRGWWNRLTE